MKKIIFSLVFVLLSSVVFSDEAFLLKSDAVADFEGYDYVSNFEITSKSGYYPQTNLKILPPNESGFRFMAMNVPENATTHYEVIPAYPSFLNDPDVGAGYIDNVSNIKSIKLVYSTNRPYDEVSLLYSTSENGPVKTLKMKVENTVVTSMGEVIVEYNLPSYQPDVTKRDLKAQPVLGGDIGGIFFRGLKITTHQPTPGHAFSEWSIVRVKEISVIYDKMFTDEQIAEREAIVAEFEIKNNEKLIEKTTNEIKEKLRLREHEEQLMHNDGTVTATETQQVSEDGEK